MNESCHALIDDLVLLYQDRKIHLTQDRVDNFFKTMRSKLRFERAEPVNEPTFSSDLPADIESLEKLKKACELRGQPVYRVAGALVDAYAKNKDLVSH